MGYPVPFKQKQLELNFPEEIEVEQKAQRRLKELKEVLFDTSNLDFDCSLYQMHRGVYFKKHRELFRDIRHDLTVISFGTLNGEFIKTYGHYHPKVKNSSFPEIYQVVSGVAVFLLQKEDLSEVLLVWAKAPETVIVPPDFGHITINLGKKELILANLVARSVKGLYAPFKEKRGGAYYLLEDNPAKIQANPRYAKLPQPQHFRPQSFKGWIYQKFVEDSGSFSWLVEPHQFPFKTKDLFRPATLSEIKIELGL